MKIQVINLTHLPNVEGFKFIGVGANGQLYNMQVMKNSDGQYYVLNYSLLMGWLGINDNVLLK